MSQSVAATPNELPDTIAGLLSRMMKELQCPICLQPITEATSTPCGHTFCRDCIQHWLKRNTPCPCCNFKLHRRLLYEAESIDRIVAEFGKLREAYEQETHENLSLVVPEHDTDWRQEPEPNLSLQYPYPTKHGQGESSSSTSQHSGQEQSATCDSEVTHVTSLEIRQAQETHARFEAAEEERRKSMATSSTISLDSPIIAVCGIKDVRMLQIIPSVFRRMGAKRLTSVTQETTFLLVSSDNLLSSQGGTVYSQAILLGKPVVSDQWVLDCFHQNDILPVEPYLVVGHKAKGQPRFFEGQSFYLDGEFRDPSKEELMSLITKGGGHVVESYDESVQIICPDDNDKVHGSSPSSNEQQNGWDGGPISQRWIIDCISASKVLDRKLYHVA
ncbi:predicted protein [Lichtheimia corymbifera JMRC:FSU:9682]|uniref:RING-type E3 ubiquitin transferase BRCA1 n=1 Tax=Lichtheimia corymbifera JMRC:FSU:9682 TaxID=1263082 RepID=A0A068SA79_9FUNG|nr:predicted protein [Lichtheimia corymbifera JMRC:FSU:9682]